MNGSMSDWEVRRLRDEKNRRAIAEAEQDHLAQSDRTADGRHAGRWLVTALLSSLLAIGVWLIHG